VLGYTLSKIIGIKIIAELEASRRTATFLGIIAVAELTLALFAVTPVPFSAGWLFVNGFALGMVFGLVLGFIEGRCLTELFVAGLCASFALADGVSKSVGAWLLQASVPERWMPFFAGLIFALPLLGFVWMLTQIPAPTFLDEATRSPRSPMNGAARLAILRRHGVGLFVIMMAYLLITVLRSIRADFAPDIWAGLGIGRAPAIFTQSELWVTFAVVIANGGLVLVRDNRRAFLTAIVLCAAGLAFALGALAGQRAGVLSPFAFMVLLGVGMYVPYVAVQTTIFERFVALTRERGNIGYLMYLADAAGYIGYVGVLLGRSAFPSKDNFLEFFIRLATGLLAAALLAMLVAFVFYARRSYRARPTADAAG